MLPRGAGRRAIWMPGRRRVNSGATTERVRDALRRAILTRAFRPGAKLDPSTIAESLMSSATPVREALNMLCGEGLVDTAPGGGFHVHLIDAPALADLYAWSDAVLDFILRASRREPARDRGPSNPSGGTIAERTALLAERIARSSPNEEHLRAVRDINARLHAARLVEAELLDDVDDELGRLEQAEYAGDLRALRGEWRHYNRRRIREAAVIARALLRD